MALAITIEGVSRPCQFGSLEILCVANGRNTAEFTIRSMSGAYFPSVDDEVVITEDGTVIFGGLVTHAYMEGPARGVLNAIDVRVTAGDYALYTERRFVDEATGLTDGTLAAGTLKSQVQTLVTTYLTVFGVTLHGSQADGPSLPDLQIVVQELSTVFNQLAQLTADFGEPYVWELDENKVLRFFQPSTVPAPFAVSGSSLTNGDVIDDVTVERSREGYANRIIVKGALVSETNRREDFVGDGVTTTYTLQFTLTDHFGHILLSTGGGELFGVTGTLDGAGNPVAWWYEPTTNQITRNDGPTTNGTTYTLQFHGEFEPIATAEDPSAATDPWEKVIKLDKIPSDTTAQAIADAELAKSLFEQRRVVYRTRVAGVMPGQQQTVIVPQRNLNTTTGLISDVRIFQELKRNPLDAAVTAKLTREVTVIVDSARTNLDRGFRDTFELWRTDRVGGDSGTTVGAGGPGAVGPAPPFTSNQFNDSGVFGGHANWTFDKTTTTVKIGLGHTVAAGALDNLLIGADHAVL